MSKALDKAKMMTDMGLIRKEAYEKMVEAHEFITKQAGDPSYIEKTAGDAWQLAKVPLYGVAAALGMSGAHSLIEHFKLGKSKRSMFAIDPSLRELPEEQVNQAFSFLSHFSPSVAKNPIAAANFVKNLSLMPAMGDPSTVKSLVDIERGMPGDMHPFTKGVYDSLGSGIGDEAMRAARVGLGMPGSRDLPAAGDDDISNEALEALKHKNKLAQIDYEAKNRSPKP